MHSYTLFKKDFHSLATEAGVASSNKGWTVDTFCTAHTALQEGARRPDKESRGSYGQASGCALRQSRFKEGGCASLDPAIPLPQSPPNAQAPASIQTFQAGQYLLFLFSPGPLGP